MTLPLFLDATYTLLVEEYTRVTPLQDFESVSEKIIPAGAKREKVPTQRDVKNQNVEAMAALKGMLAGVKGKPSKT